MKTLRKTTRRLVESLNRSHVALLLAAVAVAVVARLLPHPPNFTPLAALGLFAGSVSRKPVLAGLAVVSAMLISDAVIGFHAMMPFVYACLLANVAIGAFWVRGGESGSRSATVSLNNLSSAGRVLTGSLMGSVLFFVVTNFACFFAFYPNTMTGLITCFTAAIPFFQYTLAGDLFYAGGLFGVFALANATQSVRRRYATN